MAPEMSPRLPSPHELAPGRARLQKVEQRELKWSGRLELKMRDPEPLGNATHTAQMVLQTLLVISAGKFRVEKEIFACFQVEKARRLSLG